MKIPTTQSVVGLMLMMIPASAQVNVPDSERGTLRITPLYQHWRLNDSASFYQASTVVSLQQPIGSVGGFFIRGSGGTTRGDVASLQGLADVQLGGNYRWDDANLVLSLAANIPVVKKKLTTREFQTSLLSSSAVFDMQVPNLGAGLNIAPGVLWAIPLSEQFVLGIGASYQYKGAYRPTAASNEYDPGDEILATAGFDVQLAGDATISLDAVFTSSGKDKLAGKEVLSAGNRILANAQFTKTVGRHELGLFTRYRTRSTSSRAVGNTFVAEPAKLEPDNLDAAGSFNAYVSDLLSVLIVAQGRFYKETPLPISGVALFAAGVSPSFSLSQHLTIALRGKFQFGSLKGGGKLNGWEVGGGIAITY
jgi:hypothetical protein